MTNKNLPPSHGPADAFEGDGLEKQAIKLANDAYDAGHGAGRADAENEYGATIAELKNHLSRMRETARSAQRAYEGAQAAFVLCSPLVEYVVARFAGNSLHVPWDVLQRRTPVGRVTIHRNDADETVEIGLSQESIDQYPLFENPKAEYEAGHEAGFEEGYKTAIGDQLKAQAERDQLQHHLDQAERDAAAFKAQCGEWRARFRNMREQRDESRACIKQKLDTIERLTAERDKLQRGWKAVCEERDDALRQRDEYRLRVDEATREAEKLQIVHDRVLLERNQSNKVRADLQARLADAERDLLTLRADSAILAYLTLTRAHAEKVEDADLEPMASGFHYVIKWRSKAANKGQTLKSLITKDAISYFRDMTLERQNDGRDPEPYAGHLRSLTDASRTEGEA